MNSDKPLPPNKILLLELKRKQEKNPAYSGRALARDLGVSSAFVSKILTGQKVIPSTRLKKICKSLDMDINSEAYLVQSILYYSLPSEDLRKIILNGYKPSKVKHYEKLSLKKYSVLNDWFNIAILDILTCEIESTPKNIAKKLSITEHQAETSLQLLAKEGLVIEKNGLWEKTQLKISFPTSKLRSEVNNFHKQMIKKAYEELNKKKEQDFESRLISGITIAANPKNLELAKKTIFAALTEVASQLSEGPCDEVYQFNVQLFPLTVKK